MHNIKAINEREKLAFPLELTSSFPIDYIEIDPPFTLFSIVRNPIFLMVGMPVLLYFCYKLMPKPGKNNIEPAKKVKTN